MSQNEYLVWMDLEMTGLEPERDVIIEIATIITDNQLNVVAEGSVIAVHQPDMLLDAMDEWNTKTHGNSGLTERVRSKPPIRGARLETLKFLQHYLKAGTSISVRQAASTKIAAFGEIHARAGSLFHYRNIDVHHQRAGQTLEA